MTNWPLPQGNADVGFQTDIVSFALSNNPGVKNAWTEVVAATSAEVNELLVVFTIARTGATGVSFDLAIGPAGEEVVIASNLATRIIGPSPLVMRLPLAIAAGSRISVRGQNASGSSTTGYVSVASLRGNDVTPPGIPLIGMIGYVNGELLPGGNPPIYGVAQDNTWVEQCAAANNTRDWSGFYVSWTDGGDGTRTAQSFTIEVGVGLAGLEESIFLWTGRSQTGAFAAPNLIGPIMIPIQSGKRVAGRSLGASVTTDFFGMCVIGIPTD